MTDPYMILGVSESASDEEISKAYKRLARKYHPDLNPGDKTAETKMKEGNAAYETRKAVRPGKQTYGSTGYGTGYGGRQSYGGQYGSGQSSYGGYRGTYGQTVYGFDFEELFRQAERQRAHNRERQTSRDPISSILKFLSAFFLIRLLLALFFRPFMI